LRSITAGEVAGVCRRVSGRVGRVDPEEGRGGKVKDRVKAREGRRAKADTLRVAGRVDMGGWLRLGELRSGMVVEIVRAGGGDPCGGFPSLLIVMEAERHDECDADSPECPWV
jgi:hypothetical protein